MEFDQFSVVLFERNPDAPRLDEKIGGALRDAHLTRVAQLHEAGYVLAAGPFLADASEQIEALMILKVEPLEAQGIIGLDPIVRAQQWTFKVLPWMVPKGAMSFSRAHFPRTASEAGI